MFATYPVLQQANDAVLAQEVGMHREIAKSFLCSVAVDPAPAAARVSIDNCASLAHWLC